MLNPDDAVRPGDDEGSGPVIRDRRRIDPLTGQVRDPAQYGGTAAAAGPAGPVVSQPGGPLAGGSGAAPDGTPSAPSPPDAAAGALAELAERTADLQRLQAEFANYRKRVERDRVAMRELALANVLLGLLPVLDDIGRASEHGELTGGFKSVAESLEATTVKLGLTTYGEDGDPFDPKLHEALMHSYSPDVSAPTCVRILQPGYKIGDRILRPARVAVAEPGPDTDLLAGEPGAGEPGGELPGEELAGEPGAGLPGADPSADQAPAADAAPDDGSAG